VPAAATAAVGNALLTVFGGYSAAATAAAFITANIIVTVAINYGLTRISQALAGKPKQSTAGAVSREVTVKGTVEPMQMIYGEVRTGGFIAFHGASGDNNRFLHFVIAVAAHQCEAITDVWLDGRHIPAADIAGDGTVSTASFQDNGSRLVIRKFLGPKAQLADSVLISAFPTEWSSNHRGAGLAYVHFRLDHSEKAHPTGAPSSFFMLTKGRRLYDPRLDSTNGGSGSHRANDARTWAWSRNATLARRDYITGGSRWYDVATPEKRLGFGEVDSRIDDAFTIASANIDAEAVAIPDGAGGSTTQERYTCDVQLSCGDTFLENLRILESANVGTTSYVNGKYRIYTGAYDTPTVTINEDDIVGPMTVSTHPVGEDNYNFVTGTFYDELRDWQLCPFPSATNSSYEAEDRGQKVRSIELHATRSSYRAQRIAILHLAKSRLKTTVRFEMLSPKATAIAQNATFFQNCAEFGFTNQVMRCLDWEFQPNGFIAMTARIESSAVYADPAVVDYAEPEEATVATPAYDQPDTPINFAARSMPEGILFSWSMPTPEKSATIFRLYEHTAQTPFSAATQIWSGSSKSVLIERSGYGKNYYWLVAQLNGADSPATPVGNGLEAAPSLQGFDETFHDSFEHQDYARFYNLRAGTPTITYPTNGENGGRVIRFQNYGWIAWKKNIPYDPTQIYMMTVRARIVQAPTNGQEFFYAGLEGIAADGETLINVTGVNAHSSQHYIAASGHIFVSSGVWVTLRGYVTGHLNSPGPLPAPSISDPAEMRTGVRFVRPLIIANYNGGDGIMEVDYIRLDRVVMTNQLGPNAATDIGSVRVDSDTFNFPNAFGVQSRTFTPFDYTNSTSASIEIEVSATGSRRYTTPAGLSGTADAKSWISVSNQTAGGTLVSTTQDFMQNQIEDQPANSSRQYFESTVFNVVVPSATTYRFTPFFRSFSDVGSTGTLTVETSAYTMRIAAVKR
jgi:hypothetical protein